MKTTVSNCDFHDAFRQAGRENNFSYEGLNALFDYFEEYEDSTGEEIELDVVAICCEFTEYEDIKELAKQYPDYIIWENDDETEIDEEATLDNFCDNTQVIELKNGGIIIQDF